VDGTDSETTQVPSQTLTDLISIAISVIFGQPRQRRESQAPRFGLLRHAGLVVSHLRCECVTRLVGYSRELGVDCRLPLAGRQRSQDYPDAFEGASSSPLSTPNGRNERKPSIGWVSHSRSRDIVRPALRIITLCKPTERRCGNIEPTKSRTAESESTQVVDVFARWNCTRGRHRSARTPIGSN